VIKKILVANRGEIAVRIVRACSEMGIKSVAIYTDADRHALHVKKADEAYHIGSDPVAGYLNAHNIVNVAVTSGCDALHPASFRKTPNWRKFARAATSNSLARARM
jgi:pyruvate carboxylase subunit A